MIKSEEEIQYIKKACKITDQCFKYIIPLLKPGLTEIQVVDLITQFINNQKADLAFPPIAAFNENSSEPHHIPIINSQLSINNLILLDFGAKVSGFCSDMTRVIFLGGPTDQQKKAYQTVLLAQTKAIDLINLGERDCRLLDQLVKEFINDKGHPPYLHSLGHGVGREIHEDPRLSIKRNHLLEPGMVFTIEPGIYLEGKFGIRIEDTVLLTEKGVQLLTKSEKKLRTLDTCDKIFSTS
jgi:Xaa-Pro aminopeptidase